MKMNKTIEGNGWELEIKEYWIILTGSEEMLTWETEQIVEAELLVLKYKHVDFVVIENMLHNLLGAPNRDKLPDSTYAHIREMVWNIKFRLMTLDIDRPRYDDYEIWRLQTLNAIIKETDILRLYKSLKDRTFPIFDEPEWFEELIDGLLQEPV